MSLREVECHVVGLHSLYLDGQTGVDGERHVVFCDLDPVIGTTLDPLGADAEQFQNDLKKTMLEFGVKDCYLIKTLKGLHVFSPALMSRRETERFEERLEPYGADGFHRFMGYKNGGTVLRVTKKPFEPNGPQFIKRVRSAVTPDKARKWSHVHYHFMADLHESMPCPSYATGLDCLADEVRLEAYKTVARVTRPEVALDG